MSKISKRFTYLEKLNENEDINRAWKNIKENIKTSAKESLSEYELKKHKPRFDEECLLFSDQRKQVKMQWLQDPNQSNVDNLNNVRLEAIGQFRNIKKEYLKAKIEDLESSKTKISETSLGASMTLIKVTNLELIHNGMRKVIWLQTPTVLWLGGEPFLSAVQCPWG